MDNVEPRLKRMEAASIFYQEGILSDKILSDPYTSLEKFLINYAHERNVSVKQYPKLAKLTLNKLYNNKLNKIEPNHSQDAWKTYREFAKENLILKLNDSHNPMNQDNGVLNIMYKRGILNLPEYLLSLIKEGRTRDAHKTLTDIRGVGRKIASFYLRDIVFLSGLYKEIEIPERHLLQPIDIWVNRGLTLLIDEIPSKYECKQKKIVELCEKYGVSDIGFNQGCWMLGGVIAYNEDHFEDLVKNGSSQSGSNLERYIRLVEKLGLN